MSDSWRRRVGAKNPELAGARRPGLPFHLRQHPDIFVESLTGNGAVFSINERLVEYSDDDEPAGPARKPTTRAKPKKSYADPDEDDFDDHDAASPDHHGGKRKREEPHYDGLSPQQTEACKNILKKVKELKDRDGRQVAELFILLPTRKQLPDYYKQIAHPIDFDSIGKCLNKQGGYQTVWKFLLACELMLSNAQVYTSTANSGRMRTCGVHRRAQECARATLTEAHVRCRDEEGVDLSGTSRENWAVKVVVKAGSGRAAAQGLKVKMHNAGKGAQGPRCQGDDEPTDTRLRRLRKVRHLRWRARAARRCLEVQMKEQLHLGHEGAGVAAGAGRKA